MLDIKRVLASAPRKPQDTTLQALFTPWGEQRTSAEERRVSTVEQPALHPHPQFAREEFQSLDGWWDYTIVSSSDAANAWRTAPLPVRFDGQIRVPFSPEAPLSGVQKQLKPDELLWYRSVFSISDDQDTHLTSRSILHFEAVDYACSCYVNGEQVGTHQGGYLPFSFDITASLRTGENELALCVFDPSDSGVQLRGKQKLERGGIWYTAQSGIWQSVWLERVPQQHIESLIIDAQADAENLVLTVKVHESGLPLSVCVLDEGRSVASASTIAIDTTCTIELALPKPHLWSPEDPYLYHLELVYGSDKVTSYCAFRSITMEEDGHGIRRLYLNHQPYFLRGVLDQGYWPDGLLTAPADEALIFDIQTMKDLGFNLLRKHIKIESDRWYYHCDRLGMLVWQDMVNGGSFLRPWYSSYKPTFFRRSWGTYTDDTPSHYRNLSSESAPFRSEWTETCKGTIEHLRNHPCIITWVLFNEGWGQFDARMATQAVRTLDPTRLIDAVSGWYDQACGDFLSVHNYFRPLEVYPDTAYPPRAFVISEFGGLSCHVPQHSSLTSSYGYETFPDLASFRTAVQTTLAEADRLKQLGLAGFVYTQLSDVEEETNGLLTYDRRINKLTEGEPL